jgi:hypothetical protein
VNPQSRHGSALLLALAGMLPAMAIAAYSRADARAAVIGFRVRSASTRDQFVAEGCLVRRRAELERALTTVVTPAQADSVWVRLNHVPSRLGDACAMCMSPTGRVVDANTSDTLLLASVVRARYPTTADAILERIAVRRRATDRSDPPTVWQEDLVSSDAIAEQRYATNAELLRDLHPLADSSLLDVIAVQNAPLWVAASSTRFTIGQTRTTGIVDTTSLLRAWFVSAVASPSTAGTHTAVRWVVVRNGQRLTVIETLAGTAVPSRIRDGRDCE